MSFAEALLLAVVSSVLATLLPKLIGWKRVKTGPEGRMRGEVALYQVRRVLEASIVSGGKLRQPWIVDQDQVSAAKIENELRFATSSIANRALSKSVNELLLLLRAVWVEDHPSPPLVAVLGEPLPDAYNDWLATEAAGAERQLTAARAGLEVEARATEILRKLSKQA